MNKRSGNYSVLQCFMWLCIC